MWKARGNVPPRYAIGVEAAAHKLPEGRWVRRWHLCPKDWHLVWPDLVKARGAPDVPAKEVARAAS